MTKWQLLYNPQHLSIKCPSSFPLHLVYILWFIIIITTLHMLSTLFFFFPFITFTWKIPNSCETQLSTYSTPAPGKLIVAGEEILIRTGSTIKWWFASYVGPRCCAAILLSSFVHFPTLLRHLLHTAMVLSSSSLSGGAFTSYLTEKVETIKEDLSSPPPLILQPTFLLCYVLTQRQFWNSLLTLLHP